jgi:hypothetical protein
MLGELATRAKIDIGVSANVTVSNRPWGKMFPVRPLLSDTSQTTSSAPLRFECRIDRSQNYAQQLWLSLLITVLVTLHVLDWIGFY